MKKHFTQYVIPSIVLLFVSAIGWSQGITTAAIHGTVTQQGKEEKLPGVTIQATHVPSGSQYAVSTNENGKYNIPGARVGGPYRIIASMVGFKTVTLSGVYLELGDNYEANLKLPDETTDLSEVEIVADKYNQMNSDRTGASTNFRREQFERLPTISRSFQDITALTPQAGNSFSFGGRNSLYNNFSIDGSVSNNAYGLTAIPGGQTGAQPISMDAIQEMKVAIAPYDVRTGEFTGASVNAVTRSGDNEVRGSAYVFYRNQNFAGYKVGDQPTITKQNYTYYNAGFRIGGPIIKNKLFYFVNYEKENQSRPGAYFTPTSQQAAELDQLKSFLLSNYNYDPGQYQGYTINATSSDKILAKLDYNINKNHRLTVRFNGMLSSSDQPPSGSGSFGNTPSGGRGYASPTYFPFSNSFYTIHNNSFSVIAELNSTFGRGKFSNNFQAGFTALRDFRTSNSSPFPLIDFYNSKTNTNFTTVGYEPFTYGNTLNQNIYQVNDNISMYYKDHTFTLGTANEFYYVYNYFFQQYYGTYQYYGTGAAYTNQENGGIQQFENNATLALAGQTNATTPSNANTYSLQYVTNLPGATPYVTFQAGQFGFFAQDEYSGFKNFKLTYGIRMDVPTYFTSLPGNPRVDTLTFANGQHVNMGQLPKATPLFSPRVGFNWDVSGKKTTQIRGGSGIFTGRIPLVWAGNQGNTNGIGFGSDYYTSGQAHTSYFNPNSTAYYPSNLSAPPTISLQYMDSQFKWPQVWRTNIGIDQKLIWDVIGTLEAIYTKDINAIQMIDANLKPASGTSAEGRPIYGPNPSTTSPTGVPNTQNTYYYQFVPQALVLKNTNQGYSWSITAQLQKNFKNGFYASAAYTYTDSRDLNTSFSTASTGYSGNNMVGNPNNPQLGYSSFLVPHRIVASASYKKEYGKYFASTLSLINIAASGAPYSYVVGGDPLYDGNSNQQLMYIPKNENDILLAPTGATDTRTKDQIWNQLNTYIQNDPYLNSHRGQFAARNGAFKPWTNTLNLRFLQDIYVYLGKETPLDDFLSPVSNKRNTIQFSVEFINFLNLLNPRWGVQQITYNNSSAVPLVNFVGYEHPAVLNTDGSINSAASGRPVYTVSPTLPSGPFINDTSLNSRWQIQIGARYIFN